MKILSDFDGVFTDLRAEAAAEAALFREKLASITAEAVELEEAARAEIERAPLIHGWVSQGRLSAYADEDPFIGNIAVAQLLDARANSAEPLHLAVLSGLQRQGMNSFLELLVWAHQQIMATMGQQPELAPSMLQAVERFLDAGNSMVIVSNSSTARICAVLQARGLDAVQQDSSGAALQVRGGARKYELGTRPQPVAFGPRLVDVDRPSYRRILIEEQPDLVLGDVFSFDLALPLDLARSGLLRCRALACLQPYTPEWVRAYQDAAFGQFFSMGCLVCSPNFLEMEEACRA
ncbi:MAG: hypothetical protein RBU37_15605 [Myxococcota bacterium]|jgi:hypothetical protein|nr:hypothetical protein [Myxococcota bacterium]